MQIIEIVRLSLIYSRYRQCIIILQIHKLPAIPKPSSPRSRRPLRSGNSFNDNFQTSHMEGKRSRQNISNQSEESSRNQSTNDTQMTESSSDEDEAQSSDRSRSYSGTFSSESSNYIRAKSEQDNKIKKNGSYSFFSIVDSYSFFIFSIVIISFMALLVSKSKNEIQTQSISESISDPKRLLSESIKSIKTMFRNQESDIWNDISSAINEVSSRTPKIPSIILLFSNETTIMDCLATKLAHVSSSILHADDYLKFNPKDFGNDAGEIITILNKHSPEKKKVVVSMHTYSKYKFY